jgi:hypothetical protein
MARRIPFHRSAASPAPPHPAEALRRLHVREDEPRIPFEGTLGVIERLRVPSMAAKKECHQVFGLRAPRIEGGRLAAHRDGILQAPLVGQQLRPAVGATKGGRCVHRKIIEVGRPLRNREESRETGHGEAAGPARGGGEAERPDDGVPRRE